MVGKAERVYFEKPICRSISRRNNCVPSDTMSSHWWLTNVYHLTLSLSIYLCIYIYFHFLRFAHYLLSSFTLHSHRPTTLRHAFRLGSGCVLTVAAPTPLAHSLKSGSHFFFSLPIIYLYLFNFLLILFFIHIVVSKYTHFYCHNNLLFIFFFNFFKHKFFFLFIII